jgi:hypothetical protein
VGKDILAIKLMDVLNQVLRRVDKFTRQQIQENLVWPIEEERERERAPKIGAVWC